MPLKQDRKRSVKSVVKSAMTEALLFRKPEAMAKKYTIGITETKSSGRPNEISQGKICNMLPENCSHRVKANSAKRTGIFPPGTPKRGGSDSSDARGSKTPKKGIATKLTIKPTTGTYPNVRVAEMAIASHTRTPLATIFQFLCMSLAPTEVMESAASMDIRQPTSQKIQGLKSSIAAPTDEMALKE